jgi:hypothetical protein
MGSSGHSPHVHKQIKTAGSTATASIVWQKDVLQALLFHTPTIKNGAYEHNMFGQDKLWRRHEFMRDTRFFVSPPQ